MITILMLAACARREPPAPVILGQQRPPPPVVDTTTPVWRTPAVDKPTAKKYRLVPTKPPTPQAAKTKAAKPSQVLGQLHPSSKPPVPPKPSQTLQAQYDRISENDREAFTSLIARSLVDAPAPPPLARPAPPPPPSAVAAPEPPPAITVRDDALDSAPTVAAKPAAPPDSKAEPKSPPKPTAPVIDREPLFSLPVAGKVVMGFGAQGGGYYNDGINIAAARGTAIRAAKGGEVVYAGSDVASYGQMILIRHSDGWVSAYAHADRVLVQRGQQVKRGDVIGTVGNTGSVKTPQLHFQTRRGNRPLNPQVYLLDG